MKKILLPFIKFVALASIAIAIILGACLGIAWIAPQTLRAVSSLSHIFSQNALFFTLFRWIVLIIFYCLWPYLVRQRSQACAWTEKKEDYWLQQRFRVIAWLVIFEVLVCENALWWIFHWL